VRSYAIGTNDQQQRGSPYQQNHGNDQKQKYLNTLDESKQSRKAIKKKQKYRKEAQ
jgi:hypothetical protein